MCKDISSLNADIKLRATNLRIVVRIKIKRAKFFLSLNNITTEIDLK